MTAEQTAIRSFRLTAAVNAFKQALLKDLHIPGNPQTSSTFELLASLPEGALFTEHSWESWFSKSPVVPKISSASKLDALAHHAGISFSDAEPRFYEKLIHGGLLAEMTGSNTGRDPRLALLMRAEKYRPASPLHLHLDAIELGAAVDNFHEVDWEDVLAIGAKRILALIHDRWCPRSGSIYQSFPSPLRVAWEAADLAEREELEKSYAPWGRRLFERDLNACAEPDWRLLNVEMDVPPEYAQKMLLGMVPDANFLQGERLTAWALDAATAGLAMHALAWSDRYSTLGAKITLEHILWAAFSKIFFSDDEPAEDDFEIVSAMEQCHGDFLPSYFPTLMSGRRTYLAQLAQLGISAHDVIREAMRIRQAYPIIYRSKHDSSVM